MTVKKPPSIREAPMVRIPAALLRELEDEAARSFAGANLSRIQIVSLALREWLDGRKGKPGKTK
jgi:hypothetical protein